MSQKKNKVARKKAGFQEKAYASEQGKERRSRKKKLMVVLCLFCIGIAVCFYECFKKKDLEAIDFKFYADYTVKFQYNQKTLEMAMANFRHQIYSLPDQETKRKLLPLLFNKKLSVVFSRGFHMFAFDAGSMQFIVNPNIILAKSDQGYIWSYLVHENVHIQDYLGQNDDGKLFNHCEKWWYITDECKMEWWDAEWRSFVKQIDFLQENNLTKAMGTGPRVNNQAIAEIENVKFGALEFLRLNYVEGKMITKDILEVFPEFQQKKLKEIGMEIPASSI